jgi:hypothetical protein
VFTRSTNAGAPTVHAQRQEAPHAVLHALVLVLRWWRSSISSRWRQRKRTTRDT